MNADVALHHCTSLTQALPYLGAMFTAGANNLFEADRLARQFGTDCRAQKSFLIEHSNHSEVARIVTNNHGLPDVRGKRWVYVAVALKTNAILSERP